MIKHAVPMMFVFYVQIVGGISALDLPVIFLKYEAGIGGEETELEETEMSSYRHTVNVRLKEKLSNRVTTNLYSTFSRKEYLLEKGSYFYVNIYPDIAWNLTDYLKLTNGIKSQWTFYDELDSNELSKDLVNIRAKTSLTFKMYKDLKLIPSFQGSFDLHENPEKSSQTYTLGLSISALLGNVSLAGKYSGNWRLTLGEFSTVTERFNSEFGVNLSWDPN